MLDILEQEITYYLGLVIPPREFIIHHPYEVLVHNYDRLREIALGQTSFPMTEELTTASPSEANIDEDISPKDLRVVLGWLHPFYQEEIKPELAAHEKYMRAAFSNLWLLYNPGRTVFATVNDQITFYKVLSVKPLKDKEGELRYWLISVWGLDFNGSLLTWRARECKIREFQGQHAIRTLDIVPVEYMADNGDKKGFIEPGIRYYNIICQAPVYQQYSGTVGGS